ncbi:3-isopropylmalate dehydratase small subunit [Nocardioides sp. YIM B13467]|uniref:3-isopropylmalate dehydratase small subunit n=1 Tax=Nocardioides sp. YIM B13467 TaxID=3366294 RepID=UPI00366E8E9E
MNPLVTHTGTAVPLRRSNVDTDQIYPAQLILSAPVSSTGHADALMAEWRKDPDFVLNQPRYRGASVLVAGIDFGTGSSREWAVWALADYGFRVILAPRFGDIFRGNAAENGLVAAQVAETDVEKLWADIEAEPATPLTVDLETCTVRRGRATYSFDYPDHLRSRVMRGLDEIAATLHYEGDIRAYEARRRPAMPEVHRAETVL